MKSVLYMHWSLLMTAGVANYIRIRSEVAESNCVVARCGGGEATGGYGIRRREEQDELVWEYIDTYLYAYRHIYLA